MIKSPKSTIPVEPVFARHETFHPRFSWLKKGFDAAENTPGVFLKDDAPVILGVGKNMVRSVRYWCRAFKVLRDDEPTEFGQELLSNDGLDPFLEDPASLWLLHWQLLKPTCEAAAWYYVFNKFQRTEFNEKDLLDELRSYRNELGIRTAESSLKKDISCILRMYSKQSKKTKLIEDSIDCPFTGLGILHATEYTKQYTFRVGSKINLPPEVIVYACLEFAANNREGQKTISVSSLSYEPGSPGLAFKLPESAICDAIERVSGQNQSIFLSDTAGLIQFSFTEEPTSLAANILNNYYQKRGNN